MSAHPSAGHMARVTDHQPATLDYRWRRKEAQHLAPGEAFAYETERNPLSRPGQRVMVEDVVRHVEDPVREHVDNWIGYAETFGDVPLVRIETEVGESNHGYVVLPQQHVVLVREPARA